MLCTCGHDSSVHRTFGGDGRCGAVGCSCSCLTPSGFRFADPCPSCSAKDAKDARIAEMQAELKAGARLVATVGDKNRELENRIALMKKALKKIADYDDWVKGGRIIFGDAGQFYRGYNTGIKGQFEATKAIAEAALRALDAKGG